MPEGIDALYRDAELKGFCLRTKPSGAKIYLVRYRTVGGLDRSFAFARYGELTPEEARHSAKLLLGKIAGGEDPAGNRTSERNAESVSDLWDLYLSAVKLGIEDDTRAVVRGRGGQPKRASTMRNDMSVYKRHILPLIGRLKLKDLKSKHVARFMTDVTVGKTAVVEKTRRHGKARVTGGAGVATRALGLLGSMMTYAKLLGLIEDNPCVGHRRTPSKRRKVRLNPEQFFALGEALRLSEDLGEPWQGLEAIWSLALTGCRKSEIAKLRPEEVDVSGQALRLAETKTGESLRPIGRAALNILKPRLGNHAFVFYGTMDEESYFKALPAVWTRVMARVDPLVKMPHLTLHGLRHAYASQAGDLGFGLPVIKELIGHSAGTGVTEGYIHHLDTLMIAAADKVAGAIYNYMTGVATSLSAQSFSDAETVEADAMVWQSGAGGQVVSLQEAAVMLGVGRPTVERLIDEGSLDALTFGKQRRVAVADILTFRRDHAFSKKQRQAMSRVASNHDDADQLLSAEEAALILRMGRPTIMRLIASGELRAVKVGARFRLPASAVLSYRTVHAGRRGPVDEAAVLGEWSQPN